MSVRFKLTLLVIMVSLVPIFILTFRDIRFANEHAEKNIAVQNELNARIFQKEIDALLNVALRGIEQLAQNPEIQTMRMAKIKTVVGAMRQIYPDIVLLCIQDASGRQIVDSGNVTLRSMVHRDFYKQALLAKNHVISSTLLNQRTGRLMVVVTMPIVAQAKSVGVIQAYLDLTRLQHFLISKGWDDYKAYAIDSKGNLLFYHDYQMIRKMSHLNLFDYPYIKDGFQGKINSVKTVNFANQPVLFSSVLSQQAGWLVCSEISYQKVSDAAHQKLVQAWLIAVLIFVVIVIVAYTVAGKAVQPITLLQGSAETIAEGNLAAQKIRVTTKDEIGRLAASFQKMVDYLFRYAYYDTLTGLHNREFFWNTLDKALQNGEAINRCGAVILLDLDNFKTINDSYSHIFGDNILKVMSKRFVDACPELMIAKIGGDEFGFLLKDMKDLQEINRLARMIVDLVKEPVHVYGQELLLTASAGVVLYPQNGRTAEELLKNADVAMYKAKENGRNRYEFFTELLSKDNLEKLNMEIDLKKAVANQEFVTYYQPQYHVETQKLMGFEALVRWNSSRYGFLKPDRFIDLAERTGVISDIGKMVFRQACLFAKRINEDCTEPLCISINISPIQLMQLDFVHTYSKIVLETDVRPEWIGIEITESTMIDFFDSNTQKIRFLKELGLKVSLDDFGTGYSSLNYLRKLPVSVIKIDKSFIDDIGKDEKNFKLTEAIIHIAHELDLLVIAEGVEQSEQFTLLTQMKCDYVQGYFLGKPLPETEAFDLAQEGQRR